MKQIWMNVEYAALKLGKQVPDFQIRVIVQGIQGVMFIPIIRMDVNLIPMP